VIKVSKTELEGVLLIEPDVFRDRRGYYVETYNAALYAAHGIRTVFVQDDVSVSTKNVLRGIHGDFETWKLISCLEGEFFFVVVNCVPGSAAFGRWQSFVLSAANRLQVLVPPGYGNGHLVLSDTAFFHYKQSTYYDPGKQFTYKWHDARFAIPWPVKDPIVSSRDA